MYRNANTSNDHILRTLEVRMPERGKLAICSHDGWGLNEMDDLRYCEIFSRERYRIKVAFYDVDIINPREFATMLCKSWFDGEGDGFVWKRVEMSECDR